MRHHDRRSRWLAGSVGLLLAFFGCSERPSSTSTPEAQEPPPSAASVERRTVEIGNVFAGWLPAGLTVGAGDSLVLAATGRLEVDGLALEPRHLLWYRIGENGPARNFAADTELIDAGEAGEVYVTLRPLGVYWDDARGTYAPGFEDSPALPLEMTVEVLRIPGPLEPGLERLAAAGERLAVSALDTLAARKRLPEGFSYLPYLGRSNVWAEGTVDGRPGVHADTSDDAGIIRRPLDLPLTASTELSFDWRYDSLPARGPETEAQHHDYLSIALEFDNGQDLTWFWSPGLEAGTHFGCPLPWWDSRETHYVIQSGSEGLGEWHSHRRSVLDDYHESIDVGEPTRIVGVWFIANSIFGRQRGAASFANVAVVDGEDRYVLLADGQSSITD